MAGQTVTYFGIEFPQPKSLLQQNFYRRHLNILDTGHDKLPNAGSKWTVNQDNTLLKEAADGFLSLAGLSNKLGRSPWAIVLRLNYLIQNKSGETTMYEFKDTDLPTNNFSHDGLQLTMAELVDSCQPDLYFYGVQLGFKIPKVLPKDNEPTEVTGNEYTFKDTRVHPIGTVVLTPCGLGYVVKKLGKTSGDFDYRTAVQFIVGSVNITSYMNALNRENELARSIKNKIRENARQQAITAMLGEGATLKDLLPHTTETAAATAIYSPEGEVTNLNKLRSIQVDEKGNYELFDDDENPIPWDNLIPQHKRMIDDYLNKSEIKAWMGPSKNNGIRVVHRDGLVELGIEPPPKGVLAVGLVAINYQPQSEFTITGTTIDRLNANGQYDAFLAWMDRLDAFMKDKIVPATLTF